MPETTERKQWSDEELADACEQAAIESTLYSDMRSRLAQAARRLRQSDPGGERKPVGVAMWPTSPDGAAEPLVVCDDGSVWASEFTDGKRYWRQMDSIPGSLSDPTAPTDEAPEGLDGRAYLTEGHDGELPPVEEGERGEDLRGRIEDALRDYRTDYLQYADDGGGMQLVDVFSDQRGSIRTGDREVELLADHLAAELTSPGGDSE